MASSSSSSPEMSVPRSTNSTDPQHPTQAKLHEVLEDLSSRFILNLPDEELASLERVCFQVEQAHWYYEDFVREQDPTLPTMTLKRFSNNLFHVCPLLSHWGDDHEQTFQSFLAYKTRVPVCGAIMLNETWDKCLLVKGWKSTSAWSFPKGKINEQEPRSKCAAREVLEETGYDLDGQITPTDVVEITIRDQSLSLYIVPNVPEDYAFETRTRKEISKISWFKLTDLPTWRRNKIVPGKFYLITPFIGPLKAFIRHNKPRDLPRRLSEKPQHTSAPETHGSSEDGHGEHDMHDPTVLAHESSSQSSSADNGDPQTPSPLYSEAAVNHAVNGVDADAQHTLNLGSMDPHFARLLSSLSLSVSATPSVEVLAKEPPASELPNGSHSLPTKVDLPPTSGHHPSTNNLARSSGAPSVARVSPAPSSSATLQYPSSPPSHTSPPPVLSHNNSARTKHHDGPRSPSAFRTTATADLSPYMSRANAAPAPAIPKQMKYITMLEHIAKESERSTPSIERQAAMDIAHIQMQHAARNPSVPVAPVPPTIANNRGPLFYGGDAVMPYPPVHQNMPMAHGPFEPGMITDDPFVVRPRTSANFTHSLSTRPSMTDEQLRFMMAGPRPTSTQPMGHYAPSNFNGFPGAVPMGPQQAYPIPRAQVPPPNLRVVPPPQFYPHNGEPGPLSAPPISPASNFGPRPNAANAQLLSILNTPGAQRAVPGAMRSVGAR